METAKRIVVVFVLALLFTGTAIPAESQISNTRQASCVVQITTNSMLSSIYDETIMPLVHSPSVFGKASREIVGTSLDYTSVRPSLKIKPPTQRSVYPIQTYTLQLDVSLPDDVRPVADELLRAIVRNLTQNLLSIYNDNFVRDLKKQRKEAEEQLDEAQQRLNVAIEKAKLSPKFSIIGLDETDADLSVYEQLEWVVDLSQLEPSMPIELVLDKIKNAAEPPLQIQPNWRDLAEVLITRTTSAEIDPLSSVKLGKALDVLVAGMSTIDTKIDYVVDDGIIIIATEETLPSNMVTMVYDVSGLISTAGSSANIIHAIKETIEPISWFAISEEGEGSIVPILGNRLTIYQTPQIHLKIQNFLESIPIEISTEPVEDIPAEILRDERQGLSHGRFDVEIELARLEARKKAIEEQIAKIDYETPSKIRDDTIIAELQKMLERQFQDYEKIKKVVEAGRGGQNELMEIEEQISRTKIDIAKRREELGKSLGGGLLSRLNDELSSIMIGYAEKKAELQVLDTRIGQIESQINAVSITDPVINEIRERQRTVDLAQNRLNELNKMTANLQPPTIAVIGLD